MTDIVDQKFDLVEKTVQLNFKARYDESTGKVIGTSGTLIDTRPDLYNDICTKACLEDMNEQLHTRVRTMDHEHEAFRGDPSTKSLNKAKNPISKIEKSEMKSLDGGHHSIDIADRLNTHNPRYAEVSGSIADGYYIGYSIAFVPQKVSYKSIGDTKYRILHKLGLLNVAYTGVPVNERAVFASVQTKSEETEEETKSKEDLFRAWANEDPTTARITHTGLTIEAKARNSEENNMSNETKTNPEAPAEEATLKSQLAALEKRVEATEASNTKLAAELKAMKDEEEKEEEEKKKKGETETKSLAERDAMIAQLKAKVEEHEKFLSEPNFKARVDTLAAATAAATAGAKVETKSKAKGPIDYIQ